MTAEFTIQDVFKTFGNQYLQNHNLTIEEKKVFNAIINCKTKEMGYHNITCEQCGETITGYNSCRNRHCPMCQSYAREKWIKKETDNLLDCQYFHIITTVPYELNRIALYNRKIFYNILFKATSETIITLGENPKWLGAKVGITSILHTWGQTMEFHPHIHSIVTGGGINNNKWVNCKEKYLFKVQVLSSLFRGKFLSLLKHEHANLIFPDDLSSLKDISYFNKWLEPLYSKQWITYIEPPKGNPENVIEYIGRYAFRVAISNYRINDITNDKVTFEYKDYKDHGTVKLMTITGIEFIRRFMLHVLPNHFTKIKHYGLLANRNKKSTIKLCRLFIGKLINNDFTRYITSKTRKLHKFVCPKCGNDTFNYSFYYKRLSV